MSIVIKYLHAFFINFILLEFYIVLHVQEGTMALVKAGGSVVVGRGGEV